MSRKPKNGDQGYAGGAPAAVVQQVRREEPSEKFLYQQVQEFFTGGGLERAVYQGLYGLTGDPRYKEYEHPYKGIYREVFKKEYGREPTAIELAQWISYAPVPVTEPIGTRALAPQVKLAEATVGKIEAAIGKPTPREKIMTTEEILLEYGIIAASYILPEVGLRAYRRFRKPSLPSIEKTLTWETRSPLAKYIVGKKREPFEFWTQIVETALPTEAARGAPAFKPMMFKGEPTTPMAVTLTKALLKEKKAIARMPSIILKQKVKDSFIMSRAFPIKPTAPITMPREIRVSVGIAPFIMSIGRERMREQLATSTLQANIQSLKQVQREIQIQSPMSRQILKMRQRQIPREIRQQIIRRKKRAPSPFAKWFFKKHPIPTGSEVMKHILGK